jgi:hypothetical protein
MSTFSVNVSGNTVTVTLQEDRPTVAQVKEGFATGKGGGYLAIDPETGLQLSDSDIAPANIVLTKASSNGAS